MDDSKLLDFQNVTLKLGDQHVLTDVSFQLHVGERWAVLGQNGAGKTSLFNIASARIRPSSGQVFILGEQLGRTDMRVLRRRIGICSASVTDDLRSDLFVSEVVLTGIYGDLAPWWHSYSKSDQDRAYDLLELSGVGHLSGRQFGSLSAGEKQQVTIARALISNPDLLLLDEPTSGLDLGARERFLERLNAIVKRHSSLGLLIITHHVEDIPSVVSHCLILKNGSVLSNGPINETLSDEVISTSFDHPLSVAVVEGRFRAVSRSS